MSDTSLSFPWWVIRKVGYPILLESAFSDSYPNARFGVLESSTGTVGTDTNFKWGGSGSAKMTTANAINDGSELKCTLEPVCRPGDLLAFEQKWCQSFAQGSARFQVGLEARTRSQILQARFQWTNSSGKWQYESATDTYSDLTNVNGSGAPNCLIDGPAYNASTGSPVSWTRIVIDPYKGEYYSFEAPIYNASGIGYAYLYDMRGIPLTVNGASSRALYLPFAYVLAGNPSAAEVGYTTDWCLSTIPKESVLW
jgi:hypothetical protein